MQASPWSQEVLELVRHPDDRRLVARLLDYWTELCGDSRFPKLQDFNVSEIKEFRSNCFVLAIEDPAYQSRFRYVGESLRQDAGVDLTDGPIDSAPEGTLISRLTSEFGEVIRKQRPVGFEGQYVTKEGANAVYRGVLLPFGGEDSRVENVIGAISSTQKLTRPTAVDRASDEHQSVENAQLKEMRDRLHDEIAPTQSEPGLRDVLDDCRTLAADVDKAQTKVREKLYDTLEKVYEFYQLSEERSEEFEELLNESGLTKQDRAPFTPVLKLAFGLDYDKSRLSEYAAALAYAMRSGQKAHEIKDFLACHEGGIKGCAVAERSERAASAGRQTAALSHLEEAKEALRRYSSVASVPDSGSGKEEFVLIVGRRSSTGSDQIEVLSVLDEPEKVVAPILRRAARALSKADKT